MDTILGLVSSISKRSMESKNSIHSSPTNNLLLQQLTHHIQGKSTEQANFARQINFEGAAGCLELGSKNHIFGNLNAGGFIGQLNVRNQCSALEKQAKPSQIKFTGAAGFFTFESANNTFGSLSASDMLRLFIKRNQCAGLKEQANFPTQFSIAFMVGSIKFKSMNAANTDNNNDAEADE